jgi:hypothetical protein
MPSVRRPLTVDQREIQRVRNAVAEHLSGELRIGGVTLTTADLLGELDSALAKFPVAVVAQAALRQARAERTRAIASMRERVSDLRMYLLATFGSADPRLAAFGFEPKVRRPLTSEQRTLKAARARLTRKVRGTKGPRQRREITAEGRPGLLLVAADGTPLPGVLKGPTAPKAAPRPRTKK